MSERIAPALTPEEWAQKPDRPGDPVCQFLGALYVVRYADGRLLLPCDGDVAGCTSVEYDSHTRHALAALALYQQDFGFTREDAQNLRDLPDVPWRFGGEGGVETVRAWMNDLADRIEALLPPEPTRTTDEGPE